MSIMACVMYIKLFFFWVFNAQLPLVVVASGTVTPSVAIDVVVVAISNLLRGFAFPCPSACSHLFVHFTAASTMFTGC